MEGNASTQSRGIVAGAKDTRAGHKRIVLFFDMNSYFATVEQQANPFLRGRPVGVCTYLSDNGCIIASSKEAKRRGIVTGTRVREARTLDPRTVFIECHPQKYRATTSAIYSIVSEYASDIEPYSIDEVFCDLTGAVRSFDEARRIGEKIRLRIRTEIGEWLTCSMGIAPTRWLAKFLADVAPSGDVTVVRSMEETFPFLANATLTDAWGINTRLERRLHHIGIQTLLDLQNADPRLLKSSLGLIGYLLWAHVNGIETTGVSAPALPKQIGHTYALQRGHRDALFIERVILKLGARAGRRLRAKSLTASSAYVGWSSRESHNGGSIHRMPFHRTDVFLEPLRHIFRQRYRGEYVSHLAVGLFDIAQPTGQGTLFTDDNDQRRDRLARAVDILWDRFGEFSIAPVPFLGLEQTAVDRVGFRKTVSVQTRDPLPLTLLREFPF